LPPAPLQDVVDTGGKFANIKKIQNGDNCILMGLVKQLHEKTLS
jgi:hypothetical protein